ncbi:MAG: LacI family DNA-binding transcriptional regulator [Chloroflexota bacterium]
MATTEHLNANDRPPREAEKPPQPPTIRDVAREASVSVATVSHAFSGNRPINQATRDRIREIADLLGYRPNHLAQSLVRRKTLTLGLVIPDITNPYFPALARGAEDAARERGYALVLGNSNYHLEREGSYVEMLRRQQLAGLVLAPTSQESSAHFTSRAAHRWPIVWLHGAPPGDWTVIKIDNRGGGALAARHLIGLGHRNVGLILGRPVDSAMRDRRDGFFQALSEAGIRPDGVAEATGDHHMDGGYDAACSLLLDHPATTAIFALNDLMALGAIRAAEQAHRSVPGDLSIVGFDNIPFAEMSTPPLTTIEQPAAELGARAVNLLVDLVEGRADPDQRAILSTRLIERRSTSRAPKLPAPDRSH